MVNLNELENVEQFRVISGNPNYLISNCGRVMNGKTKRILKPQLRVGYHSVRLYNNNKWKIHNVHRLVGFAFIDNHDNLPYIDHINRIRTDNRVENLRWVSSSENARNPTKADNKTSKYIGVSYDERSNKWRSRIKINGKDVHLGRYVNEEDAAKARDRKAREENLYTTNFNFPE